MKALLLTSLILLGSAVCLAQQDQAMGGAKNGATRADHVIPVVFHIIHYNGVENISDAQVHDAVRILNEDFNRQNPGWQSVRPEFLDLVADVGIEFRLAKLDPDGNCTSGITRTLSPLTITGYQPMRDLIQWPPDRYMNVWVHNNESPIWSGGNPFPPPPDLPVMPAQAALNPASDGVMILHLAVGSIGTSNPGRAHSITMLVARWLNLYQIWGPAVNPGVASNCNEDDEVEDTPNTKGNMVCNPSQIGCDGILENVENFMDYSLCARMFTVGQAERMLAALNSPVAQRNNLITPENHALTGMDLPPALCKADFRGDRRQICAGEAIQFMDMSYSNIVERWWEFPGGSPSTSSDETPLVTYNETGEHDVLLTVTDGTDTLLVTRSAYVEVLDFPSMSLPVAEGFESFNNFNEHPWTVYDPDEDGAWEITSSAAFTGTRSARLHIRPDHPRAVDELILPPIDMTGTTSMTINFRYAHALRNLDDRNDILYVLTSNDCGTSWQVRMGVSPGSTAAPNVVQGEFVPASDQWTYRQTQPFSYPEFSDQVRVKFTLRNDGGHSIYLDDINIVGTAVGIADDPTDRTNARIVPNPAADRAELLLFSETNSPIQVRIIDTIGRTLYSAMMPVVSLGVQRIELPIADLASGAYVVRIEGLALSKGLRLIVE